MASNPEVGSDSLLDLDDRPAAAAFTELQRVHLESHTAPLGLEWRDIHFALGDKEILKGVTGILGPRQLTGVLGPSGGGKTTLLNVLSGRQRTKGRERTSGTRQKIAMTGEMSICGKPARSSAIRKKVAYVFQDIALLETETPRECLDFSASLRLSRRVSVKDRRAYVDGMLAHLHLEHCADVCVGSSLRKGLSGGEQKRVAIGVELISNPKIMFLDEPLSGLDSYNAFTLVKSLKALALAGVPMLMTLHQPSSEIFAELDDMLVIHGGEVLYHGPAARMTDHFEQVGLRCPSRFNPSDFVMFTMAKSRPEEVQKLKDAWRASDFQRDLLARVLEARARLPDEDLDSEAESEDDGSSQDSSESALALKPLEPEHRRSCCEVLAALVTRDFRGVLRQLEAHVTGWILMLIVALVYGWFFCRDGVLEDDPDHLPNCSTDGFDATACQAYFSAHLAVTSLISLNVMFISLQMAIDILHKDRPVFLRERAAGYYGVLPYFLSKSIFEMGIGGINSLLTVCGTYWLVGLRGSFFLLFLEVELVALSTASAMYCLSAAASSREQAAAMATLPQVLQFAFCGILVPTNLIPESLRWLRWVCPLYHGIQMVSATEFEYVFDAANKCKADFGESWAQRCPGASLRAELLHLHGVREGDFWFSFGAVAALVLVFRAVAVVILARKSRFAV